MQIDKTIDISKRKSVHVAISPASA